MIIQFLRAKDFKRISVAEVDAKGAPVVTIGGRNGQGKSSLLDAIGLALLGRSEMPTAPVRRGADKAEIEIGMSDGIRILRRINADGTGTLKITTADGLSPSKPQEWLDARLAKFTCDPIRWLAQKPADQAAELRKIAGIDTTQLDAKRADLYATRTDVNRDAKRARAAAESMPHFADAPAEEVSVEALSAELDAAANAQTALARAQMAVEQAKRDHADAVRQAEAGHARATQFIEARHDDTARIRSQILKLQEELAAVEHQIAEATDAATKWSAKVATVKADTSGIADAEAALAAVVVPDVSAVRGQIAAAGETNRKVRANADRAKALAQATGYERESERLSEEIATIDARKADALKAATFPIDGLSVDESGPTLGGIPLAQASQAEKIRAAMAIALSGAPTIRVVLIRDASLLDADSLAEVENIAEANGDQVWLERVGSDDDGAIIIEDGRVQGD